MFSEISPPIPKEFERYFTVNGQLLPGYRVAGQEPKLPERNAAASIPEKRESAIGRLAAAKDTVSQRDASKAGIPTEKPRGLEL